MGDVLVLTKPLGTQLATNAYIWLQSDPPSVQWQKLAAAKISTEHIQRAYTDAVASMGRLNRSAAELMHKYRAHCATDITGFGLVGHARNLAEHQRVDCRFVIDCLPIIRHCRKMAEALASPKLMAGLAVETSGGLLIAMAADVADAYCFDIQTATGCAAWRVGRVLAAATDGVRSVEMSPELKFVDV